MQKLESIGSFSNDSRCRGIFRDGSRCTGRDENKTHGLCFSCLLKARRIGLIPPGGVSPDKKLLPESLETPPSTPGQCRGLFLDGSCCTTRAMNKTHGLCFSCLLKARRAGYLIETCKTDRCNNLPEVDGYCAPCLKNRLDRGICRAPGCKNLVQDYAGEYCSPCKKKYPKIGG